MNEAATSQKNGIFYCPSYRLTILWTWLLSDEYVALILPVMEARPYDLSHSTFSSSQSTEQSADWEAPYALYQSHWSHSGMQGRWKDRHWEEEEGWGVGGGRGGGDERMDKGTGGQLMCHLSETDKVKKKISLKLIHLKRRERDTN